jgi:hypothetical protein
MRLELQSSEWFRWDAPRGIPQTRRQRSLRLRHLSRLNDAGQQNSEAEGHAQLDYASIAASISSTRREIYSIPPRQETQGSSERIIGSWLAARKNRDKAIIATKVAGRGDANWLRPERAGTVLDAKNIDYAIDGSLKRLQTDYIDLYQLHWPDRSLPLWGAGGTTYRRDEARRNSD